MVKSKFQTGSKTKFQRSAKFWRDKRMFGKLSLANLLSGTKQVCCWLSKLNWINLLKATKLIVEIAEKIRSLIFWQQPYLLLQRWVLNKAYICPLIL